MAEILGTVVGVVSLGLQVCSGISTYLEGVQCRKNDIESTTRHYKSTETLLKQIDSFRHRLPSSTGPKSCVALEESMSSAKAELLLLDRFITEVCTEECSTSSQTVNKIKEQKKKLLYPFHRDRLVRLDNQLETANKALQRALQLIELELSLETGDSIRGVVASVGSISQHVSDMSTGMQTSFQGIKKIAASSQSAMLSIEVKTHENTMQLSTLQDELVEVKTLLAAMTSSNPTGGQLLQRMLSKPDALRRICDHADNPSSTGQADSVHPDFQCRCNARRISKRNRRRLGPAFLLQEAITEKAHFGDCAFANFSVPTRASWSAGLSVKAFRGFVSSAITVTMSSASGAGGFGISPSFTYYHIRDENPAFQILSTIQRALGSRHRKWNDEEYRSLLQRGIKTLQASFMTKTSSPFDIDSKGNTLLHRACGAGDSNPFKSQPINSVLSFLTSVGVPANRADQDGIFPFQTAFEAASANATGGDRDFIGVQAIEAVCPDSISAAELELDQNEAFGLAPLHINFHQIMTTYSEKLFSFYQGHSAEPIFLRNKLALLKLLETDSPISCLSAVDAFGSTAFQHLVTWPEGLEIVLGRYGGPILEQHDTTPGSALGNALGWSAFTCTGAEWAMCSEACPCAEAVRLLLEFDSGSLLRMITSTHWIWNFMWSLTFASVKARNLVIDELTTRRERLKKIGQHFLKPAEADRLGLCGPGVLDQHTGEVLRALRSAEIPVSPELFTDIIDASGKSSSIYHAISRSPFVPESLAERFYEKRFYDVDLPDQDGFTPLQLGSTANIMTWLIKHGAALKTQIPDFVVGYTAAHTACAFVLEWERTDSSLNDNSSELYSSLRNSLANHDSYMDVCKCRCSRNGCHPFNMFWKRHLHSVRWGSTTRLDLFIFTDTICRQSVHLEEGWELPRFLKSVSLRACTFEALGLRHTCCRQLFYSPYGRTKYEEWEIEEIRDEDQDKLEYLEKLLVDFEKQLDQWSGSLTEFFRTYWKEKMIQVFDEMENQALTAEDIDGTRRLGVFLEVPEDQDMQPAEDDETQVAYWFRELDALVE